MSRIIVTLENVQVWQDEDLRVHYFADADIDADGANGQNGARAAYMADNSGSEHLANGGMVRVNGRVEWLYQWGRDIALSGPDGKPLVLPGGIIPTKTAYRWSGLSSIDPAAYVDAETVPYVVVSPLIRQYSRGIVLGCHARVSFDGRSVDAVVADIGPRRKIGELSIAAARALRIPSSPRTGGRDEYDVKYELWPGKPAEVNGVTYELKPLHG